MKVRINYYGNEVKTFKTVTVLESRALATIKRLLRRGYSITWVEDAK